MPDDPIQQPQPMQEVYPTAGASVQAQPDGTRVLVFNIALPRKILVFPMGAEEAIELGQKLAAPSIEVPANGRLETP